MSIFNRGPARQTLRVEKAMPRRQIFHHAWRTEDKTYRHVTTGRTNTSGNGHVIQKPPSRRDFSGFIYSSDRRDKERMQKYYSRCLKEDVMWSDVGCTIKELCGESIRASYRGGNFVLFQAIGQKMIQLEDLGGFLEWFDFIRPWDENDVNYGQVVWTK